jgi:lipopolysaccharide biosynthesis regulator YciM
MASLLDWLRRKGPPAPSDRDLAVTFRRALLAVLDGDYEAAESRIAEAVKADSEDVEPYRALARLYRLRGEIGRAIRIHQNLLLRRDLLPEQRNAVLAELAADFHQGGFLKRAIASYQEVLEHDSRNREALEALAELHAEARDYPAAIAAVGRLARLDRRQDPAGEARLWTRLAESEYREGRHDAARKCVKRALRRDPTNADARVLLGQIEAERGRNKAALAAWRAVAEQGGTRAAEVHPKVEASFASLGRSRDYESFLRELLGRRADDDVARTALASTLASRGETDRAVLELRRVLDTHPHGVDARIALGRLLLAAGRDAEALKEYGELIEWLVAREGLGSPRRGAAD